MHPTCTPLTSGSSVKLTLGKAARRALVSRRRSHGLCPTYSLRDVHNGHAFCASALCCASHGHTSTHQRPHSPVPPCTPPAHLVAQHGGCAIGRQCWPGHFVAGDAILGGHHGLGCCYSGSPVAAGGAAESSCGRKVVQGREEGRVSSGGRWWQLEAGWRSTVCACVCASPQAVCRARVRGETTTSCGLMPSAAMCRPSASALWGTGGERARGRKSAGSAGGPSSPCEPSASLLLRGGTHWAHPRSDKSASNHSSLLYCARSTWKHQGAVQARCACGGGWVGGRGAAVAAAHAAWHNALHPMQRAAPNAVRCATPPGGTSQELLRLRMCKRPNCHAGAPSGPPTSPCTLLQASPCLMKCTRLVHCAGTTKQGVARAAPAAPGACLAGEPTARGSFSIVVLPGCKVPSARCKVRRKAGKPRVACKRVRVRECPRECPTWRAGARVAAAHSIAWAQWPWVGMPQQLQLRPRGCWRMQAWGTSPPPSQHKPAFSPGRCPTCWTCRCRCGSSRARRDVQSCGAAWSASCRSACTPCLLHQRAPLLAGWARGTWCLIGSPPAAAWGGMGRAAWWWRATPTSAPSGPTHACSPGHGSMKW